ncbi:MAG: ATP-binding cassette domain-containing protein [bacterium]
MPALSIRSLRKSFLRGPTHSLVRTEALAGVDLDLHEGEILGIVGGKNAGKTTLLLCAAGLLRRDAGSIHWFGERFSGGGCLPGLAYVPAVPTYYPFLTIREALDCYGAGQNCQVSHRIHLARRIAARLHLADELSARVSTLGIDALKRVGIAQALMEESRVLLLDGTCDDLGSSATLTRRVISEAASEGVTVFIASRHPCVLAPIATRIVVIDSGCVAGCFAAERSAMQRVQDDSVFAALPAQMRHIAERVH